MTHSGEKALVFIQCEFACTQTGGLKVHMLKHRREKPSSCNQRNYKCSQAGHLRTHMLTHSGQKPFACNQCSYTCKRADHLKKHMLTHSKDQPFNCSQRNYNLKKHMLTQTGEKVLHVNIAVILAHLLITSRSTCSPTLERSPTAAMSAITSVHCTVPILLRFSKSLGPEPLLTNINYVEFAEVSSILLNNSPDILCCLTQIDFSQFPWPMDGWMDSHYGS